MNCNILLLIVIAFFTGFIGDIILQILIHYGMGGSSGWGLKSYFQQHGKAESPFIAAGMMTLFYIIYFVILKIPLHFEYLIIYGIVLDLIFRYTMVFPSLKDYYYNLNIFESGLWGAIPMVLPALIMYLFKHTLTV